MNRPSSEPVIISDSGRMRKYPPHSPFHWLFAVQLMISITGALWQHGHAGLTIGLLAAVPLFAASVYLPYRWVPALARSIANCILFGCALGWSVWRMKANFPDLVMIEGLCIASLIFMAGGKHRDYFYLFFISIFLLIYGALIPRMTHLYLTAAATIVLLVIGLFFRSDTLAGKPPFRMIHSSGISTPKKLCTNVLIVRFNQSGITHSSS